MNDASTFLLFVRVGFSLAIVLGLIWIAARVAKRRGKIATRQAETTTVDVVARRQLGRRGSLLVVESSGRRFLVGVTDNHIELVADLSGPETATPIEVPNRAVVAPPIEVSAGRTEVAPPIALPRAPEATIDRLPVALDADQPTGPRRDSLFDALRDLTVRR